MHQRLPKRSDWAAVALRRLSALLFGALLLLAGSDVALAVAKTATAAGGGTWATATWVPAGVPTAADTCTINDTVVLTINTAAVCGSLTMGDNSNLGDATLTLAAGGSLDITTAGGQSGNVVLDPFGNGNNYTIVGTTQSVTIRGTLACDPAAAGTYDISVSTGQVFFTRAAGLTLPAGCSVTVTGNNAGGSVNFTGLLTQAAGSTIQNITSPGTINFNAGYSKTGGTFSTLNGEAISIAGNMTVSGGALTFANTSTTTFTASATITPTSVITFSTLVINPGTGNTVTLAGPAGNTRVARNLTVSTGTFNLSTFTANRTAAGGTLTVANGATLQIGGTRSFPTNYTTHTLGATSTVEYNGTTQAVTAENYGNLTLTGSGTTKTPAAGTYNIAGDFTVNSGVNVAGNTSNPIINLSGNFTESGNYTSGTGVFTFTGAAAQTWSGNSTTLTNLTINKSANSVSITSGTSTVTGTLTLTSGNIVTAGASCAAATPIIVDVAGTISGGSTTSYIQGALRKNFNAGAALNFRAVGQDEFPIGIAGSYLPIEVRAGTTSTAGNIIACVTATDDPNMTQASGGGIDTAKSVNRYWSMTTTTINTAAALVDATFKFPNGATEYDAGANAANFIVERWDGTDWNSTTLVTAGATSTRVQNVNISAATNEFEIGEPLATFPAAPGAFNAFDTTAPAAAILANIQTKQAGTSFSVRVVHIANNAIDATYNQAGVTVELYNSSNNGGAFTNACRSTWTAIAGTAITVNFAAGVATATFAAANVPNVFRDVRVHVIKTGAGSGEGCSTDRFAIRPTSLTIDAADVDWQTAGTSRTLGNIAATGGNVHAASDPSAGTPKPFTLRATPQAAGGQSASNYDGNPTVVSGFPLCCTPSTSPACGTLPATCSAGTLSYTAASWAGTGTRTNGTAQYTEAGVLNVQLEDANFASVDANDGSSAATRTVPATGTASIGRFVPDGFAFTGANTPQLQTFGSSCATRSFTYIGAPFWYATLPSATLQAVNAAATVVTNYRGSLFKLTNAGIVETYSNNAVGPTLNVGSAVSPPQLTGIGNGTATYTAAASAPNVNLTYTRSTTTLTAPYNANISVSVVATDASENAVVGNPGNAATPALTTPSPLVFNGGGTGIAFDSGSAFRYGRMRLLNASGPLYVAVPVTLRAEYYVSASTGFGTNTADNCSSFVPKNFVLFGQQPSLTAANMVSPTAGSNGNVSISGNFVNGVANLSILQANPSVTTPGAVKICLDLDSGAGGDTLCQAATPAGVPYLQGPWSGSVNQDKDPNAQLNVGTFGAQPQGFIYFRENY